jgi:hypothetical protein
MHSTRCGSCEDELRRMERVQELVSERVSAAVDEVDFAALQQGIDQQLDSARPPWWTRLGAWWSDLEPAWLIRVPAFAGAVAVAALGFLLWTRAQQPTTRPDASLVASMDNAASIESLDTDVDAVTVLNDPETRTTVLWVSDDTLSGGDVP